MKDKKRAGFPRTMLYALIGVTAGIYLGFYFLGYDNPYVEDPNFNAPVLTDFLIGFLMMLLVAAFGVGVWAVVRGLKERDKDNSVENGVRVARIFYGVLGFTAFVMLLSFVFGSSKAISVNGVAYTDVLWLRAADTFVVSAIVMILAALGAIAFGYVYGRRQAKSNKELS